MTDDLQPLSARLSELLDAERPIPAVDSAMEQRLKQRVAATLGLGGGGPDGGPGGSEGGGPLPDTSGFLGRLSQAKTVAATAFAVGVAVGGAVVGGAVAARAPREPPAAVSRGLAPIVIVASSARATQVEPGVDALNDQAAGADRPLGSAPELASSRTTSPERGKDTDLAAERALLSIARTAIGRRDADAALSALRQHKQKFPKGQLSEERESLWVQALMLSGNSQAAKQRAESFKQKYPESMLGRAVDQALEQRDGG